MLKIFNYYSKCVLHIEIMIIFAAQILTIMAQKDIDDNYEVQIINEYINQDFDEVESKTPVEENDDTDILFE